MSPGGLFATLLVLHLSIVLILPSIEGRKCVCTSKSCKEIGVNVCRTKFYCYTEVVARTEDDSEGETVTRGCTESATPLLCETGPWSTNNTRSLRTLWPRLKCCNERDYCNDENDAWLSATVVKTTDESVDPTSQTARNDDRISPTGGRVKPLHLAALLLAIAALISVLAACYVITRFLRMYPYVANGV